MDSPPHERFGRLLVLIVASFLLLGINMRWAALMSMVVNVVLIVVAFRATSLRTTMPRVASITVVALLAAAAGLASEEGSNFQAAAGFAEVLVMAVLVFAILRTVLAHRVVSMQTIVGALSAYLLIGLAFSWLYYGVDVIDETAFSLDADNLYSYSEFSFVVLTTLGFGNEVPTSPFAGRLVILEALGGQIFLATFVARLVALYGQQRQTAVEDADR